ncbi:MAG: TIGR01777 family oxidoreductase [Bacteroidales bacterium]|nr:TIGR01777 family oxidoreductase [Bacteroidales bacterium]
MQRIVITGAGGLVGKALGKVLSSEGYDVVPLSRSRKKGGNPDSFLWDPERGIYENDTFREGDVIINLAGANIGEKRWSRERKREILESRIKTSRLLFAATVEKEIFPSAFITASATGIYGSFISERIFTETDTPADDFLGETCRLWEGAADPFDAAGVRVVKIRTSVVMAPAGSALSKLRAPAAAGMIIRFAPGHQYVPWIHIHDLCMVYLKAVKDTGMKGVYNAASPEHITHDMLMKEIARQKSLPLFLPHIPEWLSRIILGEMSLVLTTGSRVSPDNLIRSGFKFRYPDIGSALKAC